MYIYIRTCINTPYVHLYIYTYISYTYTKMYAYEHMGMCKHTNMYYYAYIHTVTSARTHTCLHIRTGIYIHIHMYLYICVSYTCMYLHFVKYTCTSPMRACVSGLALVCVFVLMTIIHWPIPCGRCFPNKREVPLEFNQTFISSNSFLQERTNCLLLSRCVSRRGKYAADAQPWLRQVNAKFLRKNHRANFDLVPKVEVWRNVRFKFVHDFVLLMCSAAARWLLLIFLAEISVCCRKWPSSISVVLAKDKVASPRSHLDIENVKKRSD